MINSPLFETKSCILTEIDYDLDPERDSILSQDLRYARYLSPGLIKPLSKSEIKKIYEKIEKSSEEKKSVFHFAVRVKRNNLLIGFVRIHWISWNNATAALKVAIGDSDYLGKVEGELISIMAEYAFKELNLYRLDCYVSEYEQGMEQALIAANFSREVTVREGDFMANQYWDRYIYGISGELWLKNGEKNDE